VDLICGINPVVEALSAEARHFDRLLIAKGVRNRRIEEAISRASRKGIALRFESRETLDRLAGSIPHQGIIAVVSAKPVMALETLLDQAQPPGLVVLLDGVEDPRNLGAILRTSEAAGADGVILPERHSAGLSETVSRASAGGLEHVKVARVGNVAQSLETLKSRDYWVVGFDASGTERWDAVDYKRNVALVFGGEGRGIRRLVRDRCDHLASIPLFGHVASLNVSVAAAVALYEVVRQRGDVPSYVRPIPARAATAVRHVVGPRDGDAEGDPGRGYVPGAERDEAYEEDSPEPLRVLGDHEEAAWSVPTVMKAVGHLRHGGSSHAAQAAAGMQREGPRGRRRRRGRHGGPGPGERPGAPVAQGARPHPPAEVPTKAPPPPGSLDGAAPPPGAPGGAPGHPGGGRRRRRRRRR
jgi:23S rRNA (guanosine2251-2'-O)-methyltransferase